MAKIDNRTLRERFSNYGSDYDQLHQYAIDSGHDRVVAITCASYCEKYIQPLLEDRMAGLTPELRENLFGLNRPLTSAAVRFDVAEALGVLSVCKLKQHLSNTQPRDVRSSLLAC